MDLFVLLIIIFLTLLAIAFISVSETAVIAIRPSQLRKLIAKGSRRAEYLQKLRAKPERLLSFFKLSSTLAIVIAATTAGLAASLYLIPIFGDLTYWRNATLLQLVALIVSIIVITTLIYLAATICAKGLSIKRRKTFALWVSAPAWYLLQLVRPLIAAINGIARFTMLLCGLSPKSGSSAQISEAEIRLVLRDGLERGIFSDQERKILHSLLEFTTTTVRRAMTPRTEIVAFDINASVDTLLKAATEESFSRFPVYEENIDNIKGFIHSRDLLYVFSNRELFAFKDIIKQTYFTSDSKPISVLFREMKKGKFHIAIVLDEFGGTAGIITMEDIIEEIIGDIQDEYDHEISKLVIIGPNRARVQATMPVDEFADEFGVEVETGDFETVGGMLVDKLERIPGVGERSDFSGFYLEVELKDGHRILSLIAGKLEKPQE
jgi:putative hemolysin